MLATNDSRKSLGEDTDTTSPLEDSSNSALKVPISPTEKIEEVRVVEVTEFHKHIYDKDWTKLERALKKFNGRYYKRVRERSDRQREKALNQDTDNNNSPGVKSHASGSPRESSPRRSRGVLAFLPKSLSNRGVAGERAQEKLVVSPLLRVDEEGRTPLHLAYLYECPDQLVLDMQKEERLAAKQADNYGQLPLHLAMTHRRPYNLIEKLIKAHPNALKTKDVQGRTPIGYTVELAVGDQEELCKDLDSEHKFHWGKPVNDAEKSWQYNQMKIWNKVDFLLKDLMRRKKSVIPSEHGLLLEAIESGAPNKVVNRFISTTDKYLKQDDDFAGSALSMCVTRQYSLDTLEYLIENCREGTTVIQDYTEKSLIAHYRRGCQPISPELPSFGKEIIEWCKANPDYRSPKDENKQHASGQFLSGASIRCQEWWGILRYLLFFAAYGKDFPTSDKNIKEIHMLHAALTISSSQPSFIQLLLVIFPEARNEMCPLFMALPVHLVCTRWRYDVLRNDKDASMEKVLKMFLKADKEQVVRRYKGRLPLHMALMVGQSWSFVKSFVNIDKHSVGMRDPQSKLFPFQLAAVKISSKNLAMMLRHRYTPTEWKNTHPSQKQMEFDLVREQQARRQVGTVYELLRLHPDAITGKYLVRDSSKKTFDIQNAGLISMHYLTSVYQCDGYGWRLNPSLVRPLRDSIKNGYISKPLTAWWNQMKDSIWGTTPSDMIPVSDEYLLHAALYNPDTPPTIVELLLGLFPMAASTPIPGTGIYPLHIAAGTVSYHPQSFEYPYTTNSLELILRAFKPATRFRVNGQLPIHMALARGKTWEQIQALVRQDSKSLLVPDQLLGLMPVELISSYSITSPNNMRRFAQLANNETRGIDMDQLPVSERATMLRDVKKKFDLSVLSTAYELLRRAPAALIPEPDYGKELGRTSSLSSIATRDKSIAKSIGGVAGRSENVDALNDLLQNIDDTPVLIPKRGMSLASYLEISSPRSSQRLLDLAGEKHGISLSQFVKNDLPGGRQSSSRSLISKSSGGQLFDDFSKPSYDDDNISSMGGSFASSILLSPSKISPPDRSLGARSPTSFSTSSIGSGKRRGRRPTSHSRRKLPDAPNLD